MKDDEFKGNYSLVQQTEITATEKQLLRILGKQNLKSLQGEE